MALTDARIPDEHGIVLGPPAEYLYCPPDLVVPPYDRIQLPQRRPLGEVDPELVERIVVMCNRGITYLRAFNVIAIIKKIKRRPMVSLAFPESA